jgi:sugar phosphate isomerase/epimerase
MKLCLNQVTAGRNVPTDLARDLAAMREGGWTAVEVWLRHWDGVFAAGGLRAARALLDDAGLVAAGACAQPGLYFSRGEQLGQYRDEIVRRLEQCQALGAPNLVVTPSTPGAQLPGEVSIAALEYAADNLRWAGDRAASFGVRLGLEFLKGARFVNNLPTALTLANLVDHPQVGVVVDTFHLYAGLSKVEDLDLLRSAPERLFFVHVNDVPAATPREMWVDADRVLPGEGAFPLAAIVDRLRALGYEGYVSLELFNEAFAARWAADPAAAARVAYERTAALLAPH